MSLFFQYGCLKVRPNGCQQGQTQIVHDQTSVGTSTSHNRTNVIEFKINIRTVTLLLTAPTRATFAIYKREFIFNNFSSKTLTNCSIFLFE